MAYDPMQHAIKLLTKCPQYLTVCIIDAKRDGISDATIKIAEDDLAEIRQFLAEAASWD